MRNLSQYIVVCQGDGVFNVSTSPPACKWVYGELHLHVQIVLGMLMKLTFDLIN